MGKKGNKKPPAAPGVCLPPVPPGLPPAALAVVAAGIAADTPRTASESWPSTPGSWRPPSASRATAFERALAEAGLDEQAGTDDADDADDDVAPVAEKEGEGCTTLDASAPNATDPSAPNDAGNATDVANLRARLEAAESRFEALRADFHYNLALLKDRDAELEAQDETIASLERAIAQRDVAAAELDARLIAATASSADRDPGDDDSSADGLVVRAAVDRARLELTARHDEAIRALNAQHAAELETERVLREASIADADTKVEAAYARARAAERDAQLARSSAERALASERDADARLGAAVAEAEARVKRAEERETKAERRNSELAETKQRLLDEYEEKCDALVASMRDVEAHFESMRDDRERAERERSKREEDWRLKLGALEKSLEKAREKEADERTKAERERDEAVLEATRRLAEKASGLALEVTRLGEENERLGEENERLGESLAQAEGRLDAARSAAETSASPGRERERLETERRLRARAESAEAAMEELRREYAARSLAAAAAATAATTVDSEAAQEAEDREDPEAATEAAPEAAPEAEDPEAVGVATEDPEPKRKTPPETRAETKGGTVRIPAKDGSDPRETAPIEPGAEKVLPEYWLERFDVAARAVSAAMASLPVSAPDRDVSGTKGRVVEPEGGATLTLNPTLTRGLGDDGSGLRERMRALRASLSATGVDAGTPAPIETTGKAKKKKKTMKKKKASSPQPRQRRSSPSPSPSSSSSSSSGLKKLKNLKKALRALKARPRVAKKRAERRRATTFVRDVETRSAPLPSGSFASHRTAFGRTTTDPLPGTYRLSPPRKREALDAREEAAVARLIRPRSSRVPTRVPTTDQPTFRPRGYSRPLGAVPRRPPREPFEPPRSFRAPSPPSPTPLDDEELSRFEAHWNKENARHRHAAVGGGDEATLRDGYFALSPRSKRWTTSAKEGASREGVGPARDLIAAGEDRLAALERRRREHRAVRMAMRFNA